MRILIAEDEGASLLLLKKILAPYGRCDHVRDGRQAVAAFEKALRDLDPYDLVCMDIMMPVMDGQDALRAIRDLEERYEVVPGGEAKALMITCLGDGKNVSRAFFKGLASDYMLKPVSVTTLREKMESMGFHLPEAQ